MVKKVLTITPQDVGEFWDRVGFSKMDGSKYTQEDLDEFDSVIQERVEEIIREMRMRGVRIDLDPFLKGIVKYVEIILYAQKGNPSSGVRLVHISQKNNQVYISVYIGIDHKSKELTIEQPISEHGLTQSGMRDKDDEWQRIDPFYGLSKIVYKGLKGTPNIKNSIETRGDEKTKIFTSWERESKLTHTKGDKYSLWIKGKYYFSNKQGDSPYLDNIKPKEIIRINIAISEDRTDDELKESIKFYEHFIEEARRATGIHIPVYFYNRKDEKNKHIPENKEIKII